MEQTEFKNLCKEYLPNCHFKDNGTCGLCCYSNGDEVTDIAAALLPSGKFAVYDQWRDITITEDVNYLINWLKHVGGK